MLYEKLREKYGVNSLGPGFSDRKDPVGKDLAPPMAP